jgi:signal transduction histidine kinase
MFVSNELPLYYFFEVAYNLLIAYGIVRHGAMDIKTVIHKTLLWLSTSAVAIVPIVLCFWFLFPWITDHPSAAVGVLVIICIALLVYARTIQPYVDHRFQRRRYDLYQAIQQLVEDLVPLKGIDAVSEKVVSTVRGVLYVDQAFVVLLAGNAPRAVYPSTMKAVPFDGNVFGWLADHDRILARTDCLTDSRLTGVKDAASLYLKHHDVELLVPFVKDGTLLGVLHVGVKRTLTSYSSLDLDFLNRLRAEVTVAYHNSLLFENVTALSTQLGDLNKDLEQKVETRTLELRDAVDKLTELDRAKSEFFANVSHELRTPLTLILAPIESLLKGEVGRLPAVHQRHVQIMHQNALRLLKQINNLLDLAKFDAGRMELKPRRGNLSVFLKGLVASVAPMADKKRIEFIGQEQTGLPEVAYFDQDRLEKVVLNLVSNALKFTSAGGRVEVTWGLSEDRELRVQVRDTGIGIARADLPKLFKRFSQVESSANRRFEGTGIGLALAKEIVELHGGHITVDSEPGRGTTMTVTIPLWFEAPVGTESEVSEDVTPVPDVDWTRELHVAAERGALDASETPESLTAQGLSPSNGVRVLVVEDNSDMQEFIAFQLQGEYQVLRASNGVEGVHLALEALPDLIVSDVMMPEKDGYQLCREVRANAHTSHIPIILLTAHAGVSKKIEGLEHGADEYLTKPFNAEELRAKIKSLLALRALEREIQQRNEALEAALAELKATQSQLVQSEKMAGLGVLVAGMAHEINNPINFAKNSLTVLERAWRELKPSVGGDHLATETVEDLEASIGIVRTGVERTEQIVTQLKVFARKDQQRVVQASIQEGMESTLHLIRPTLGHQVVLHTDLQATGLVHMIAGKLNQVWMNLVQNAVQAVGAAGEIWVTSRDLDHSISVSIRDTGSGIKKEHMPKLFEPFFTTKPVGQGTGLGLSVSYQIIQEAGGRIDVKSEEGQGAEFTVVLPRVNALAKAA